ncbi:MAG: adenosine kinase [Hyphomicrobiaceae bacterium]|nr:adenosine kinase [Hyphomicrobiaceae bacterium]
MSASKFDVAGIGNAIVDVIARCDDAFLSNNGMEKGFMQLVTASQADDIYAAMGPAQEQSGGSAANTCAGIASFGGTCAFIGRVATDQFGKVFAHDITSIGVAYDTVPSDAGLPTARCLILVTPDGERTMNTFLGASTELGPEDVDGDIIAAARITYLEGYLFDRPEAKAAFHEAARLARAAGRKVALSLSDAFCVDRHRSDFLELVRGGVDILFANETEITSLYELNSFEEAAGAVRAEAEIAALTRSEQGSVVISGNETHEVPPDSVDRVVDATGAGDLYAAGFLTGLTRSLPLETCGRLGSLAAAEVISHVGARPEKDLQKLVEDSQILAR